VKKLFLTSMLASFAMLSLFGCSCGNTTSTAGSTTAVPTTSQSSVSAPTTSSLTATAPATTVAQSTSPSVTALTFPRNLAGNYNWTGQATVGSRVLTDGGTMSVTVDASGAFTGSITSSKHGGITANLNAQVDPNGNSSGTISLTIEGTTYVGTWQGMLTKSGNSMTMQGNWTGQTKSGTFSATGTPTGS